MRKMLVVIVWLISGCAFFPQAGTPVNIYNFGTQSASTANSLLNPTPSSSLSLRITDITSPTWLDHSAIHYRLAYHDATQLYTYASSRWAEPPAALLTQQIRNQFIVNTNYRLIKSTDGVLADYTLHLNLEEFTQVFETTDNSHVVINLHASLIARQPHALFAQRNFQLQQPSLAANATGAVHALIASSNQLGAHLIDWLVGELATHENETIK